MRDTSKNKIYVKFPMAVLCVHSRRSIEESVELVAMNIEVADPEVPAYAAKCPKCGREIIIEFNST